MSKLGEELAVNSTGKSGQFQSTLPLNFFTLLEYLPVFKFHVNRARQHNHVVRSLGTVCESRVAGRKFSNPERRACTRADIVGVDVMADEASPLRGVSGHRVVNRHSIG